MILHGTESGKMILEKLTRGETLRIMCLGKIAPGMIDTRTGISASAHMRLFNKKRGCSQFSYPYGCRTSGEPSADDENIRLHVSDVKQ